MSQPQPIYCPSGRCQCPTPQHCLQNCYFNTAEGGSTIDTRVDEQMPAQAGTFRPDFEVEHYTRQTRPTVLGWVLLVLAVIGFVWAAVHLRGMP